MNRVAKCLGIWVALNMVSFIKMVISIDQMLNNALKEFLILNAYISKFKI